MFLEYRIHGVKSRIQDYLGFPLTGRNKGTGNQVHFQWQFNFISKGQPRHEPRFYVLFLDQTFMTLIFYFQPPGQSWRVKPWLFDCANYKKLRCCKGTLATEFYPLKRVQGQVFEKF